MKELKLYYAVNYTSLHYQMHQLVDTLGGLECLFSNIEDAISYINYRVEWMEEFAKGKWAYDHYNRCEVILISSSTKEFNGRTWKEATYKTRVSRFMDFHTIDTITLTDITENWIRI